jgi:hypothetical protein
MLYYVIRLGEQCLWEYGHTNVTANIPLPITRYALHSLCDAEMRKYSHEIFVLQNEWEIYAKQNHYNRLPTYAKSSYIKNAPLGQRGLKLLLFREATVKYHQKRDRDTMLFEDDLSRLMNSYTNAKLRKIDYDQYYILASRYGMWTEQEFNKDATPGTPCSHLHLESILRDIVCQMNTM